MASESRKSSVGVGFSSSNVTVVAVIPTTGNQAIWQHYDLCEMSSGPNKARCKKCGTFFKANSNLILKKHLETNCITLARSQATMSNDGNVWNFDVIVVQDMMAKFVIQESLSFDHFDNPRLTKFIQETLQPRYTQVSRTTLRRDCFKMWKKAKNELILEFENLKTGVSLTCDVWTVSQGSPYSYLCVTAHWVNPNTWQMMRRTIKFEFFGYTDSEDSLFEMLDEVITTYKLANKIFFISFDDVSSNSNVVAQLKVKYRPTCNGVFFYGRCIAHVINLIVQESLNQISDIKESFKQMLRSIFSHSNKRYYRYMKFCRDTNNKCFGPNWDEPNKWNTTYNMFATALKQKDSLKAFHDKLVDHQLVIPFPTSSWILIEQLTDILGVLKSLTTSLSGVYYPTSSLVLKEIWILTEKLSELEMKNEMFSKMIRPIKAKIIEYLKYMSPVITCAAALNPCLNVSGVEIFIEKISCNLDMQQEDVHFVSNTITTFNKYLSDMFDVYKSKYLSSNIHESTENVASSGGGSRDGMLDLYNKLRKRARINSSNTEFKRYTETDFLSSMTKQDFENFDTLAWWKENECQFPILASMARDLLTVQASTVALESAFSVNGRVISQRRTKLTPASLEMCICLKDHLDAIERIQHISSLESDNNVEVGIHEEEGLSDEEFAFDEELHNSPEDT